MYVLVSASAYGLGFHLHASDCVYASAYDMYRYLPVSIYMLYCSCVYVYASISICVSAPPHHNECIVNNMQQTLQLCRWGSLSIIYLTHNITWTHSSQHTQHATQLWWIWKTNNDTASQQYRTHLAPHPMMVVWAQQVLRCNSYQKQSSKQHRPTTCKTFMCIYTYVYIYIYIYHTYIHMLASHLFLLEQLYL